MANKNYWMHRISLEREIKRVLLDNDGLLLTGWGKVSSDDFLGWVLWKDREAYKYVSEQQPKLQLLLLATVRADSSALLAMPLRNLQTLFSIVMKNDKPNLNG